MTGDQIAKNIRLRAFELGVTQADLAESIHRSPATFKSRMAGKSAFTYEELFILAERLQMNIQVLTGKRLTVRPEVEVDKAA